MAKSTPQGLWSDPAWQLVALKQYLAGESPSLNQRVEPLWQDLSRDYAEWIYRWPPGTQLAAYPLMKAGIALGDALRIIAIATIIIGSLGWMCWFSLFNLPVWLKTVLALFLPWIYSIANFLFWYSPDVFVYSSAPWIILATHKLGLYWNKNKPGIGITLLTCIFGFLMGFLYILKYTAVFVSLAALVYLGIVLYEIYITKPGIFSRRLLINFAILVIFSLIPVLGLDLLNYKLVHKFNLITATYRPNLQFNHLISIIGLPVLTMTGGESLGYQLYFSLFHPMHNIVTNKLWFGVIGLPGGILLWWLIFRSQMLYEHKPTLLAITVFVTNSAAMFLILSVSFKTFYAARHFISGSMAVLPCIIQSGISVFKDANKKIIKAVLLSAFIMYILLPLRYEYITIHNIIAARKEYATGPMRLHNPSLAHHNLPAVLDKLKEDFNPSTDVWYIPDPVTALDIPGRAVIQHVDYTDLSFLQRQKLLTRSPCRIRALIPAYCEENGKAEAIRASFVQAQGWSKKVIEDSDYVLWTTTLKVADKDKR